MITVALVLAGTSPAVVAAIITAGASLLVALITGFITLRNSLRVRRLEEVRAEADAQRAYRYEARKRLYAVCEPVLFQAIEQAGYASSRICSLARTARDGHLQPDGNGWMFTPHKYYFCSIVYGLLAPLTGFPILQRQLTTIDLQLDDKVRQRYELLKLIFLSPSQDWELAEQEPSVPYDRNKTDSGEPERERLLRESPEQYAPQGLYRATIYVIAEALTAVPSGCSPELAGASTRCISFGEFVREWEAAAGDRSGADDAEPVVVEEPRPRSTMAPIYDTVVDLFRGFHPASKPVLWRVLTYQHLLYRTLTRGEPELVPLTADEKKALGWRPESEDGSAEVLSVAEGFAHEQLATLRNRLA